MQGSTSLERRPSSDGAALLADGVRAHSLAREHTLQLVNVRSAFYAEAQSASCSEDASFPESHASFLAALTGQLNVPEAAEKPNVMAAASGTRPEEVKSSSSMELASAVISGTCLQATSCQIESVEKQACSATSRVDDRSTPHTSRQSKASTQQSHPQAEHPSSPHATHHLPSSTYKLTSDTYASATDRSSQPGPAVCKDPEPASCAADDLLFPCQCIVSLRPALSTHHSSNCSMPESNTLLQQTSTALPTTPSVMTAGKAPSSSKPMQHEHLQDQQSQQQQPPQQQFQQQPQHPQQQQQLEQLTTRFKKPSLLPAKSGRIRDRFSSLSLDGSLSTSSSATPKTPDTAPQQRGSRHTLPACPIPITLSRSSSTTSIPLHDSHTQSSPQNGRSVTLPGHARVSSLKPAEASPPKSGSSTPSRPHANHTRFSQSSITSHSEMKSLQRSLSALQALSSLSAVQPPPHAAGGSPSETGTSTLSRQNVGLVIPPSSAAARMKMLASIRKKSSAKRVHRVFVERLGKCVRYGCSLLFALVDMLLKAAVVVIMIVSLLSGVSLLEEMWTDGKLQN